MWIVSYVMERSGGLVGVVFKVSAGMQTDQLLRQNHLSAHSLHARSVGYSTICGLGPQYGHRTLRTNYGR